MSPQSEEASEQRVTVVFPGRGGQTGVCPLLWKSGQRVKEYLRTPPLKQHGLVALALRSKMYTRGGDRVRFSYVPKPGDVIVMIATG